MRRVHGYRPMTTSARAMARAAALAGCLLVAPAWGAQPGQDDPLLEALVAEALAVNPDFLAAREELAAARSRPDQVGARPDPMVSFGYVNDGWRPSLGQEPMTTLGVMASQALPLGGKTRLRGEIAAREADAIAGGVERARLRLTAAVARAYYDLAAARELLRIAQEQREVWVEIEGVARARYAVGQGAQQDVLRTQVELTRAEQRETELAGEAVVRLAELNRLVGRRPDASLTEEPRPLTLRALGLTQEEALARAQAVNPERGAARVGLDRDRLALRLAHADGVPDLVVQGGYMNRGDLAPMWQAGVGVSLPLNRRRRTAAVAEAAALLRAREQAIAAIDRDLAVRTYERVTRLRTLEARIALYDQGIVPQDRTSVEAALANYRTGAIPFVSVLEALTTLHDDRAGLVRLLADHARLRSGHEAASLDADQDMAAGRGPSGMSAVAGRGAAAGMDGR